ncbi:MAG TPA: Ig-like domain-containing protein [Candidatus Eremiobacteraceae bacterium]|nr:Ig-like domain-containing protein [Candidatus Eremiobacteraceae bacterium]
MKRFYAVVVALAVALLIPRTGLAQDQELTQGSIALSVSGAPAPADGRSLVTISGTVLDANGNPIDDEATIGLSASLGTFVGDDATPGALGFHVKTSHGMFVAVLRAPLHAGQSTITAFAGRLKADAYATFTTELHPSLAAGAVSLRLGQRGSDLYESLDQFLTEGGPTSSADVFAETTVGQSLVTAALDASHPINGNCNGTTPLYGSTQTLQTCQPKYPLYGDTSTSENLANSSDNVYFRVEHDASFLEWGDYDTSEFGSLGQQYSAAAQNLHGVKGTLNSGDAQITGFSAVDLSAFQRDMIAPDGTSGAYALSRRLVVPGSERVTLELQPIDRPGDVVSVQVMSAGVDYVMDYAAGTITFALPVARTQVDPITGQTLMCVIVVSYQYDGGNPGSAMGGRVQLNLDHQPVPASAIGISTFDEDLGDRRSSLVSGDVTLAQPAGGGLSAEWAASTLLGEDSTSTEGSAFRVNENAVWSGLDAQVSYAKSTPGFSNDATAESFVAGQTRYGATVTAKVKKKTSVSVQTQHEDDNGSAPLVLTDPSEYLNPGTTSALGAPVDTHSNTTAGSVKQQIGGGSLALTYATNSVSSTTSPILDANNSQLGALLSLPFAARWNALAEATSTVSGGSTALYPSMDAAGVSYRVTDGVALAATAESLDGGTFGQRNFVTLGALVDRHLGDDSDVTANYTLVGGANGFQIQQQVGLDHRLLVSHDLRLDVGYEDDSGPLSTLTASGMQFEQPFATGVSTAGLAPTGGASYHAGLELINNDRLQAGARIEQHLSGEGTNTVDRADVAGELSPVVKILAAYDHSSFANQLLGALPPSSDLRVGIALRNPSNDDNTVLLSYEDQHNPGLIPDELLTPGQIDVQNQLLASSNIIAADRTLSLDALQSVSRRLELYEKVATRQSDTMLSPTLQTTTNLVFAQARVTYLLGQRYDTAVEYRVIDEPALGYDEYGRAVEFGYYLSNDVRLAAGYGGGHLQQNVFDTVSRNGPYVDLTYKIHSLWK